MGLKFEKFKSPRSGEFIKFPSEQVKFFQKYYKKNKNKLKNKMLTF